MSISQIAFTAALFLIAAKPTLAEELPTLNELLDERIEKNIEYRDDFAEDAKESTVADILVPAEKDVGQRWIDLLRYVRASDDISLKAHMLRLDYAEEVRGSVYDIEYAEGVIEIVKTRAQLAYWQLRLNLVDKVEREQRAAADAPEVGIDPQSIKSDGERVEKR